MIHGVLKQLDVLLPLFVGTATAFGAVVLLAIAATLLRRTGRCEQCGERDRRPWRYCARCGWPRRGSPRGGGAESVANAIAPAWSKAALDPRSPASRLRAGWCQGAAARDRGGRAVFPRESAAASWSLPGAMAASLDSGTPEWTAYLKRLSRVLGAPSVSVAWLVAWNDDPSRTQADVVAAAAAAEKVGC